APLPFFNSTSKEERKQHRRQFRRPRRPHPGYSFEDHTIVGYGDGRFKSSMKTYEPLPVETFRAVLARRTLVVLEDEYRTSVVCSYDDSRTRMFRAAEGSVQVCREHRKRRIRRIHENGNNSRRQCWCLDDEKDNLVPTSQCDNAQDAVGFRRNVYALKFCDECDLLLDRDINGARNIGRILLAYIESNGDVNSRPLALSRGNNRRALVDVNDDEFDQDEEQQDIEVLE
ncbi:hypothetical protein INT45_000990, partial [Circinella minor]